jgi:hypothetical protein
VMTMTESATPQSAAPRRLCREFILLTPTMARSGLGIHERG